MKITLLMLTLLTIKLLKSITEANDEIYLYKHCCDLKLYRLVLQAKENLRNSGKPALAMRVEGSIKTFKSKSKSINGRYTITVLLSEFLNYHISDVKEILNCLGFTLNDLSKFIPNDADYNTDVIFGRDNQVGKIYFDNGKNIVCYESTKKTKSYQIISTDPLIFKVTNSETKRHIGTHRFVKERIEYNGFTVYWIARDKNNRFKTYYTRPGFAFLLFIMDLYYAY